jgi:antirestriction protein ArdC
MSSSFLCSACGIVETTLDNSVAYIKGWLLVLKSKDNKGLIIQAASAAQKSADYILGIAVYSEA